MYRALPNFAAGAPHTHGPARGKLQMAGRANMVSEVRIADESWQPVEPGIAGEILILRRLCHAGILATAGYNTANLKRWMASHR